MTNATKVFVFDEIFDSMVGAAGLAKLRATGAEVRVVSEKGPIGEHVGTSDPATPKILCINPDFVNWSFQRSDFAEIPGLAAIVSSSDNTSWLDTDGADGLGIKWVALENLTTEYAAVAEYAITIMLNLARNVPRLVRDGFPLDYAHDFIRYQGVSVTGKTAGIIGLGNIGGAIAERCAGLGMNVVQWSRSQKPGTPFRAVDLDELLKTADVVFPTLKRNAETERLLPIAKLDLLRFDAIVVSVVDGLVDNEYLAQRVADNRLFGFGFGAGPGEFGNYSGNVWATPDYAWATGANMRASYEQFLAKITDMVAQVARTV